MSASLRIRLTAVAGLVVATTLVGAGALMVRIVDREARSTALDAVERTLADAATRAASEGQRFDGRVVAGDGIEFGVFRREGELAFGSMYVDDREVAIVELNLETKQINELQDPRTLQPVKDPAVIEAADRLVLAAQQIEGGDAAYFLVGAVDPASIEVSTDAAERALWLIFPPVLALMIALIWMLVGRALAPVDAITDRARRIGANNLDERVPVPGASDEIGRLATTINAMLDRLEHGDRLRRQFSADVSHELRSPLSVVRAAAEVIVEHPDRAMVLAPEIVTGADRLEGIIDDLLSLASLDKAAPAMEHGVDLIAVVDEVALDQGVAVGERLGETPPIEIVAPGPVTVCANEAQIRRAVGNLVANALHHAGGKVRVTVASSADGSTIEVEDDGPGIAESDRVAVFERFTRLDTARARTDGGAGLGLALVKAIVESHGGMVDVTESTSLGGAHFRVILPNGDERSTPRSQHLAKKTMAAS